MHSYNHLCFLWCRFECCAVSTVACLILIPSHWHHRHHINQSIVMDNRTSMIVDRTAFMIVYTTVAVLSLLQLIHDRLLTKRNVTNPHASDDMLMLMLMLLTGNRGSIAANVSCSHIRWWRRVHGITCCYVPCIEQSWRYDCGTTGHFGSTL